MRTCLATALLVASLAGFAGDSSAVTANTLPPEVSKALGSAKKLELYSLEPWFDPSTEEEQWHDNVLLGKTTLSADKAKLAVTELNTALKAWDGKPPICEESRQAIRIESEGKKYDLLLGFECHGLSIYRDDKLIVQLGIGGSPRPFNKLLTDAKIPLSQSGSD